MTLISIEVTGERADYCEVFFRSGEHRSFGISQAQFREKVVMQTRGQI